MRCRFGGLWYTKPPPTQSIRRSFAVAHMMLWFAVTTTLARRS